MSLTSKCNIALVAVGALGIVLALLHPHWPPAAVVTVVALLALPGQAVMAWVPVPDSWVRAAFVLMVGASVLAVVAVLMVWTKYWHPRPAAVIVLAASIASLLLTLRVRGASDNTERVEA